MYPVLVPQHVSYMYSILGRGRVPFTYRIFGRCRVCLAVLEHQRWLCGRELCRTETGLYKQLVVITGDNNRRRVLVCRAWGGGGVGSEGEVT